MKPSIGNQNQNRNADIFSNKGLYIEQLKEFIIASMTIFFFVVHTSTPVSTILKITNGSSPSFIGAIWYLCGLIGIFLAIISPSRTLKALFYAWPFLVINLWAFLSVTWSVAPSTSLKSAALLFMSQLGAIALAARYSWLSLIRLLTISLGTLIFLSVLLAIGAPSLGRMQEIYPGAWSGLWTEKQGLGFCSVMMVIFCLIIAAYSKADRLWLLAVPIGIIAILGTGGKTALVMVIFAIGVIMAAKLLQTELKLAAISLLAGTMIVGILILFFTSNKELIFQLTGKSSDFTGRAQIWEGLDYLISQRPTQGWGYSVIWDGGQDLTSPYQWIMDIAGFKPANAHSTYREALLSLGKIGLYLLVFVLGKVIFDFITHLRSKPMGAALGISVVGSLIFISFTETVFLGKMDFYWMLVVLLGTKIAIPDDVSEEAKPHNSQITNTQSYKGESFTYEF